MPVRALGIFPHTGWAWVVTLEGPAGAPRVVARAEVAAVKRGWGHLYHLAADTKGDRLAELARLKAEAFVATKQAMAEAVKGARAAAVLGKRPALPSDEEKILASHAAIHTAEGELWRALFADACGQAGLETVRGVDLKPSSRKTETWLKETGAALGSPWNREVQAAALAAWSVL